MHRVAVRIEQRGKFIRDAIGDRIDVVRRDDQIVGESARAINPNTLSVRALVLAPGAAIATGAADDMTFAGNALPNVKPINSGA